MWHLLWIKCRQLQMNFFFKIQLMNDASGEIQYGAGKKLAHSTQKLYFRGLTAAARVSYLQCTGICFRNVEIYWTFLAGSIRLWSETCKEAEESSCEEAGSGRHGLQLIERQDINVRSFLNWICWLQYSSTCGLTGPCLASLPRQLFLSLCLPRH